MEYLTKGNEMKYIIIILYLLISFGFASAINDDPKYKGKPDTTSSVIMSLIWPVQLGGILAYQYTDIVLMRAKKGY